MDYLKGLNDQQLAGVVTTEGPVLLLAGAGSGKTKVLVSRAAYLLQELEVRPYNILAITFTNKAAKEMKDRMEKMVGDKAEGMWIGTFHNICLRIIRFELEHTPYRDNFVIYDTADQTVLVKECLAELHLDDKTFQPRAVLAEISRAKNLLWNPDKYLEKAYDSWREDVGRVYKLYQKRLIANNALDFDDLIFVANVLLKNNSAVLEKYQERFQYLMVDEYQDTNFSQYSLIKKLGEKHQNVFAVGDPDQSIYSWRGADISNIMNFEKDYKDTAMIKLEQNYRSTKNILDGSNSVIEYNVERKPKQLWSANGEGEKIQCHQLYSDKSEANFVIEEINRLKTEKNYNNRDFAVVYRTHAQSRNFEDNLARYGIPYKLFGGLRFWDRAEIKDTVAYLRVMVNPDDEVSLHRIINVPKRGIGEGTWKKLQGAAAEMNISAYEALNEEMILSQLTATPQKALRAFYKDIEDLKQSLDDIDLKDFLEALWLKTGYLEHIKKEDEVTALARRENLGELLNIVNEYEMTTEDQSLADFLANISLSTDLDNMDNSSDYISLMTIHATKGLEFPVVFITGLEQGIFPSSRSMDDVAQMEEERRLCYVGMTRAEQILYMTRAKERFLYGRRHTQIDSAFLKEIPTEYTEDHKIETMASTMPTQTTTTSTSMFSRASTMPQKQKQGNSLLNIGDKVQHGKFGVGVVTQIKGTGEATQVSVAFPNQGIKTLMLQYAPIKKL